MQVSYTEFGTFDMNGEEYLASARQALDIAVSTMLGTAGDGSGALLSNLGLDVFTGASCVYVDWLWRQRDYSL